MKYELTQTQHYWLVSKTKRETPWSQRAGGLLLSLYSYDKLMLLLGHDIHVSDYFDLEGSK